MRGAFWEESYPSQKREGIARVKVLPTAWEVRHGLLRRTPSLRTLERDGAIRGQGWTLRASGDWYEAREFYESLGLRETPLPILLVADGGEAVWAEALPLSPKRFAPQPKEAKDEPPPPEERPKRRVRIGGGGEESIPPQPTPSLEGKGGRLGMGEERGRESPVPPPPKPSSPTPFSSRLGNGQNALPKDPKPFSVEEVHRLLWEVLGGEEFGRYSVDPYLRHRGLDPDAVWEALAQGGHLREEGGFFRLRPPSWRKVVIEDTDDIPSYLKTPGVR